MGQVTLRDLSEWIDIQAEREAARKLFEAQQNSRRNLNAWLVYLLPWSQLIVFVVFYLLSAPHTVYLVERITPNAGKIAPVGFELGVIFVAAMRQKKWRNFLTLTILWSLMAVNVIINVGGGFIAVVQSASGEDMARLTLPEILGRFGTLPAEYQILFPLVVIIGALVPVMGKFSGEAMIKLATGEIKLESVSIEDLWLKEQAGHVKSALMQAAMKKGAGPKSAGVWAQRVVDELFGDSEDYGTVGQVPEVRNVQKSTTEMGFAANLPARVDTQNTEDGGTHQKLLRAKQVSDWIDSHEDEVKLMLARPGRRRNISMEISQQIAGKPDGYKTVERILKAKGYDF